VLSSNVRPQKKDCDMPDATAPPVPATHLLRQAITQGREMAAKPVLAAVPSNLWVLRARGALSKVYGENAAEVDFWCPLSRLDPPSITPQNRIASRLPHLERLAALLAISNAGAKIFIGHGRSTEWLKLRIFLSQTLGLACDEFNIEPTAGLQTGYRVDTMLNSARMAFLIMTAEDRHADGTTHARQNVIHEIGLFQAKLGPNRAIVMLEEGCSRFSNLDGLTTINFPRGDIMARSEDIRGALARERIY